MDMRREQSESSGRQLSVPTLKEVSDALEHPKEKPSDCSNQIKLAQLFPYHSSQRLNYEQNLRQGYNEEEEDNCSNQSSILSCLRASQRSENHQQSISSQCQSESDDFEDQQRTDEMDQGFPCEGSIMSDNSLNVFEYQIVRQPQRAQTDASYSSSSEGSSFSQLYKDCLNTYQYLLIQESSFSQSVQESAISIGLESVLHSASSSEDSSFSQLYNDCLNNDDYDYLWIFRQQGNNNETLRIGQYWDASDGNNQSSSEPKDQSEWKSSDGHQ